ncbi:twin-arginine translocation signal domain-containing protein, partial [Mycobacterium palustre]|uniref:twin-arginine translocation signal domain-containing protein n=1 Tax=Mycobacterium palustre TaxID=153971 RepID=UPI0021F2A2EB
MTTEFGCGGVRGAGSRVPTSHRKRSAHRRGGFFVPPFTSPFGGASDRGAPELSRRRFLGALAAATVAGVGAARVVVDPQPRTFAQAPPA